MNNPKISIGMPVYNGEKSIRNALDSLLAQSFTEFELIISDNASIDETEDICREYAEKDKRILYVRQPSNIGPCANFKFVLDAAKSEFFMWAACDDVRSPDYLSVNYNFLINNKDYVASTSPVRFEGGDFDEIRMGDASLSGEMPKRIINFFNTWHTNGRFYSLMRRDDIKTCTEINEHYFGSDMAVVLQLAKRGKLNRSAEGYTILGKRGMSNRNDVFSQFRKTKLDLFFPFARLTKFVSNMIADLRTYEKIIIYLALIKLNIQAILNQLRRSLSL